MKYSKCGLELPNSSSRRIDSQSRSSAGVNQHNPIKTKRTTLIYSTKRSGLEAFKNSIWKINSSKTKTNRKNTTGNVLLYPTSQLWLFSFPEDVLTHHTPLGVAHKAFLHCCPFSVRFHSHQPFSLEAPLLIKQPRVIQ